MLEKNPVKAMGVVLETAQTSAKLTGFTLEKVAHLNNEHREAFSRYWAIYILNEL